MDPWTLAQLEQAMRKSREIIARLSLILRKAENGDIEVVYSFLNGIRRKMSVDFEATKSVIYNTDRPWRSRCFSIESIENDPDKIGGNFKPDKDMDHISFDKFNYADKDEQYEHNYR